MSQPTATVPSRSGPMGLFVGGLILLLIAALSTFLLPKLLVFNQQMQQSEVALGPEDMYDGQVQSGQSTDIPEGFMVTINPDSLWESWDPETSDMPPLPVCTVEGPSGAVETIDMYGSLAFETLETGSYTIDCEGGGNIWLSGQSADQYHQQDGWTKTLTFLTWTSWITLGLGILLTVAGAYKLGERNVERKIALERVYAEVAPAYPAAPVTASDGAPAAPAAGQVPAPQAGATGAPSAAEPQPPAQPALPPVTRPKNSRQSRDPFAD